MAPRITGTAFVGLDEKIQQIANRLPGTLGIAAKALRTDDTFLYNERASFLAASTIKVHILMELFNQVEAGKIQLANHVEIPSTGRLGEEWGHDSSGILKELESVKSISIKDAATLMIVVSDNVASNLLIDILGIDRIQKLIEALGLGDTKLERKFMDLEAAARGLQNTSTPYDMTVTLEKIADAKVLTPESCETIQDILSRTQDVLGLRRLIPQSVRIEHKTGELADVCNDVAIVRAPGNPFAVSVMTAGVDLVQGWDAVAEIGRVFYERAQSGGQESNR